jgi:uncharacterized protein YjbI with pentapeptide repeats
LDFVTKPIEKMNDQEKLVEKLLLGVTAWNQWRQENHNQTRLDLSQVNLSGANLRGVDLSEVDLDDADLSGADLSDAKLYAASLWGANLSRANLVGAALNGAILIEADLSGSDLSSANLRCATALRHDQLFNYYRDQYLPILQAMQRYSSFTTNLMAANLHNANLQYAQLQGVIFQQANLTDANLKAAALNCANFSSANLSGADLREAILVYINLRNTKFSQQTKINERWRRISSLVSCQVKKPYHWHAAKLQDADLRGADLSETIMHFADLRGADLINANLMGADFSHTARIAGVKLEGAKYDRDTILPNMSQMQKQTLVFVDSPVEPNEEEIVDLSGLKDERKRTNSERVSREDQQKFRELLKDAFQGKCAITQCDVERAIDAAHIFPYRGPQTDGLWNGILLRLDLHRLFDSYLLTIDAVEYQVRLSPSLMDSCYREYANTSVCFPEAPISLNRKLALQWHNAQCHWLKNS